jgi:hypothetical protein
VRPGRPSGSEGKPRGPRSDEVRPGEPQTEGRPDNLEPKLGYRLESRSVAGVLRRGIRVEGPTRTDGRWPMLLAECKSVNQTRRYVRDQEPTLLPSAGLLFDLM